MAERKQKLELTWIGKENLPRLEPRILLEDPDKSCHAAHRVSKKESAVKWCANASSHAQTYGGKPWLYVLIPHNQIAENMTLEALVARFGA